MTAHSSGYLLATALFCATFSACAADQAQVNAGQIAAALADPAAANLAKPTPEQVAWADGELEMFLCLDPASWQGGEYDNGSTPLDKIVLPKLNTDQWCEAAHAFGAKQIVHVLKHTGFCWWQTDTTPYSIKNTQVGGGKADIGKMLSDSCHRAGLKYGIYVSVADRSWGAGIGGGGRTRDSKRQEGYNAAYRQQMTEALTRFGQVSEIWFDGGCKIPVQDIIEKNAPKAVIFGGPKATLRWPGTESGKLPYPCWASIGTGVNSDGEGVGNPDGTRWCPPECDTVLYGRGGHNWFWAPFKEARRHSADELMDIYLKSVGRGGVLLLNATPNTDGLIPEGDMKVYREFGAAIARRFGHPLAQTQGVGETVELDLGGFKTINQASLMEDTRGGHRIRAYVLEGRDANGTWHLLTKGSSVGHKKIDVFHTERVDKMRMRVTKHVGTPILRNLSVFMVDGLVVDATALSQNCPTVASSVYGKNYRAALATDGDMKTRWSAKAGVKDVTLEVDLGSVKTIGSVRLVEFVQRIRHFQIEARASADAPWQVVASGTGVGSDLALKFAPMQARFVRFHTPDASAEISLAEFQVLPPAREAAFATCGRWAKNKTQLRLDLTPHILVPATYAVVLRPRSGTAKIRSAKLYFNGVELPAADCIVKDNSVTIRQTQQVTEHSKTELVVELESSDAGEAQIRTASEE